MSMLHDTTIAPTPSPLLNGTGIATTARAWLSYSPRQLLSLPFRGLYQAETFAFSTLPRRVTGMASHFWGSQHAGAGPVNDAVTATTHAAAGVARDHVADAANVQADSGLHIADFLQAIVRLSGFFSYLTSRWSLACFSVGLVLNRITIYASTRRHLHLDWHRRLALRIIPILLFTTQILSLLRSIRCQTSPNYSYIRYGGSTNHMFDEHAGGGGFLYSLGATLLPWESDEQSCSAVHMSRPVNPSDFSRGSYALLWPVFLRLCLSHFVETLSCALQGRAVVTEAGMSIFEHSFAFAEAELNITQSLGLGLWGLAKPSGGKNDGEYERPTIPLSRAQALQGGNVTPELLLIALLSCCNSLTSNVLDVLGKQSRYRLFNTGFWGLCFMLTMAWGMVKGPTVGTENLVLKFPSVCILGFVPHLVILFGIVICAVIYAIALVITAFSMPLENPEPITLRQRFGLAHENMQGATQMHSIRVNRHEDFYTTLLRIGYTILTAASEAVFLNEGKGVIAREMTWLEEERLAEIQSFQQNRLSQQGLTGSGGELPWEGQDLDFTAGEFSREWESGYGREKKIAKPQKGARSARSQNDPGVGILRFVVRFYHGFSFFRSIFRLLHRWMACGLDKLLDKCGISWRPQWLKKALGGRRKSTQEKARAEWAEALDFWILNENGGLELPGDFEFDVETEMRKRERSTLAWWEQSDERRLDDKLYDWWKAGGSWGNQDQTPDYAPSNEDWDDTTSVVSMSTTAESEWEDESDGRRTPTQEEPFPEREGTPQQESLMDISSFARLLDPRDQESRQEARILAAHLSAGQNGRILTRRQYQQQAERERANVLLSSRRVSHMTNRNSSEKRKPSADEESEILENLILSHRSDAAAASSPDKGQQTWESGASGLGPSGPPCVICQTSPRSIITWPCRCLCVCEECRVSLAMNNFGSCVTCRQEVSGFVRLWVP